MRLKDGFAARATFEPAAARMAAELDPTRAALRLRKQIIAEYELLGSEPPVTSRVLSEFHICLVELSGNRTLALLNRALQQIVLTHLLVRGYGADNSETAAKRLAQHRETLLAHEKLDDLIGKGEGAAAEAHWRGHWEVWMPVW